MHDDEYIRARRLRNVGFPTRHNLRRKWLELTIAVLESQVSSLSVNIYSVYVQRSLPTSNLNMEDWVEHNDQDRRTHNVTDQIFRYVKKKHTQYIFFVTLRRQEVISIFILLRFPPSHNKLPDQWPASNRYKYTLDYNKVLLKWSSIVNVNRSIGVCNFALSAISYRNG